MKVLIVFNHPAPYKVKLFNELSKKLDLFVIFERKYAKDRPANFYSEKNYQFNNTIYEKGYLCRENSFTFKLKKYIKENHQKYDLIVMNGYATITEQIAINYMIKHKIPYILYINGGVIREKENKFIKKLKRRYISHAFGYLSPNEKSSLYLTYYGANRSIIHYPYCTYFENEIKKGNMGDKERDALREKYGLPKGKLFISASNFIKRKNNFELFDAFKDKDCSLVLYGDGPLKKKYVDYLAKNNIKNVYLKDFVFSNELMDIMSCCDSFITLSKEDIYGHTTLEAFASGIPVISSNKVVSSLSVIKDYENGFVVNNKKEIDYAIEHIDYSVMSKNCIETAKQFSIEKEAEVITEGLKGFLK